MKRATLPIRVSSRQKVVIEPFADMQLFVANAHKVYGASKKIHFGRTRLKGAEEEEVAHEAVSKGASMVVTGS